MKNQVKFILKKLFLKNVLAFIDLFFIDIIISVISSTQIACDGGVRTICTEAATGGFLLKKVFLKILLISQEYNCVGVFFLAKFYEHLF